MVTIDLNSKDGNIFSIMSMARKICQETGKSYDVITDKVLDAGSYEEALRVIKEELGDAIEFVHREGPYKT